MGRTLVALGIQHRRLDARSVETAVLGGNDVAQVSDLPPDVAAAFGINVDTERVTRREAMSIPAVRRGRQVIAGTISRFPLVVQRIAAGEDGRPVDPLPDRTPIRRSLLEQPDPWLTPSQWKTRVVDDLIFLPFSFCRVAARDNAGFPTKLEHIATRRLRIDYAAGKLYVDNAEVPDNDIVRFDGPGDGLLFDGATVLRTALDLEAAVRRYAKIDVPLGVLRDDSNTTTTGRDKLTDTAVTKLLDAWEAGARKRVTRYIGRLKYEAVQMDAARIQLAEARQRSDTAIAQLLNLESPQINAPAESSMTYNNRQDLAAARLDTCGPYMDPITERLSMPDITPRGQVVTFDTTKFVRGTTTEVLTAAGLAVQNQLMSRDEARARFLDLPPMTQEPTPNA